MRRHGRAADPAWTVLPEPQYVLRGVGCAGVCAWAGGCGARRRVAHSTMVLLCPMLCALPCVHMECAMLRTAYMFMRACDSGVLQIKHCCTINHISSAVCCSPARSIVANSPRSACLRVHAMAKGYHSGNGPQWWTAAEHWAWDSGTARGAQYLERRPCQTDTPLLVFITWCRLHCTLVHVRW